MKELLVLPLFVRDSDSSDNLNTNHLLRRFFCLPFVGVLAWALTSWTYRSPFAKSKNTMSGGNEMGWYWNHGNLQQVRSSTENLTMPHPTHIRGHLSGARILGQLHGLIGLRNVCPQILAKARMIFKFMQGWFSGREAAPPWFQGWIQVDKVWDGKAD